MSNSQFCITKCPLGEAQSKKLLADSESVFDAVADMQIFID